MKAASYLKNPEVLFLATNDDETFPSTHTHLTCPGTVLFMYLCVLLFVALLLGTGCMVKATALAANRQPIVLGKPNEPMFDFVRRRFPEIDPKKTLMVGDR